MQQGQLYIIAAPSGAGKTSLVRALVERVDNLVISVSHVTRPQREGEVEGINYHFVSEATFKAMIEAQQFLEYAKVFGFDYYYGTSREWVFSQLKEGKDVVLEIDWQGARQVRAQFSNVVSVFILPPSLPILQQRLIERKRENAAMISQRMQCAQQEIAHYTEFEYLVINEDFEAALQDMVAIIRAQRLKTGYQRQLQQKLLTGLLEV